MMTNKRSIYVVLIAIIIMLSAFTALFRIQVVADHDAFWESFTRYGSNPVSNDTWGEESVPSSGGPHLHCDVLYFENGKQGYDYWCYYTPYPYNDEEDLCLARSNSLTDWSGCFAGTDNPITNNDIAINSDHTADPDVLCIPEYDKFFIFLQGNPGTGGGRTTLLISNATHGGVNNTGWNSTKPYNCSYYDGDTVSSEGNPVINYWDEDGAPFYENQSNECAVVFDRTNETFVMFYSADTGGDYNGERQIGKLTFQYNNSNGSVYNKTKHGLVYFPAAGDGLDAGTGHINVVMYNGSLWMVGLRSQGGTNDWVLDLARSDDWGDSWLREYKILEPSVSGWDDTFLYRSSIVQDGYGNAAIIDNKMWLFYTGSDGSSREFGVATADLPWYSEKYMEIDEDIVDGTVMGWGSSNDWGTLMMLRNPDGDLVKVDNKFWCVYSQVVSGTPALRKIGIMNSSDMENWADHPSNPIFGYEDAESWEYQKVVVGDFLYMVGDSNPYWLFYSVEDSSGMTRVGVANTSMLGTNFTRDTSSNPIFEYNSGSGWAQYGIENFNLQQMDDGVWIACFEGQSSLNLARIGIAKTTQAIPTSGWSFINRTTSTPNNNRDVNPCIVKNASGYYYIHFEDYDGADIYTSAMYAHEDDVFTLDGWTYYDENPVYDPDHRHAPNYGYGYYNSQLCVFSQDLDDAEGAITLIKGYTDLQDMYVTQANAWRSGISFESINEQQNNTQTVDIITEFNWTSISGAVHYELQIANDSGFTDIFINLTDINETNYGAYFIEYDNYVEFILPEQYRETWYKYYYFRVRAYYEES